MAPRKSTARSARPSHASSIATSSKVTLDSLPPPDVPVSITPDYTPSPRPRVYLDETEKERSVYELVGFYPRKVCDDITKSARDQIDTTIGNIENWAQARAPANDDDAQREMNIGSYAAESLLESRVDKECDKFTAWMSRNPFDFKGDKEYVLPWHAGLDFARGEFVTNLPEGQATSESRLEDSRTQTERARLVSQRLAHAEEAIDRRLEIAKQRKAEVGFVKEVLAASGLSPSDHKAGLIVQNMTQLHSQSSTLEPPTPSAAQPVQPDAKAWEMGRRAYSTWAVNKVAPAGGSGEEVIEGVERDMRAAGGSEGVEAIGRAAG